MRTVLCGVGLLVLAGCVGPGGAVSPSPVVSPVVSSVELPYVCTPEGGGVASPCSREEFEAQVERNRLYEEAESVYRKLNAADDALYWAGAEADESVLQYVEGLAREDVIAAHSDGSKMISGESVIRSVRRLVGKQMEGSSIALSVCVDNSQIRIDQGDGGEVRGIIADQNVYFAFSGDQLRIVYMDYLEVESC